MVSAGLQGRGQRCHDRTAPQIIPTCQLPARYKTAAILNPNNPDDPEYIVRLVGQVVRVSAETVKIVAALPERYAKPPNPGQ